VDRPRPSDDELRALLDAGELRRAAAWLVEQHAHEVLALCRALVRDEAAAEDLAQETFGRAFAGLAGFRGEASARTWLLTIARHGCIDHLRARHRDPWAGAGDADPDALADDAPLPPELLGRRRAVAAALAELSEGERALVVLRFGHGFDYAELAATFGLREGTVRRRLCRALGRMRAALAAPAVARRAGAALLPAAAAPGRHRASARPAALPGAPPSAALPGAPPSAAFPGAPPSAAAPGAPLGRASAGTPPLPHPFGALVRDLVAGEPGPLRGRLLAAAAAL
jgi:RNA polymerase sigma-70 factor (ECF subfamily)